MARVNLRKGRQPSFVTDLLGGERLYMWAARIPDKAATILLVTTLAAKRWRSRWTHRGYPCG
jgi:hypothetical protein